MRTTVPNVTGKPVSQASAVLKSAGLSYSAVGSGTVTAQSPSAGTAISKNGTVVLYADGQSPEQATVPNVTGKTLLEANTLLTEAGLNVSIIGWRDEAENLNVQQQAVVASQSIEQSVTVPSGTVVEIRLLYTDAIE